MPVAPSDFGKPLGEYSLVVAGALLFVTPWIVGFATNGGSAWNMWIVAGLVGALGAYASFSASRWLAWALMALAMWLFLAPWALAFTASAPAFWSHVIGALGLAVLSAASLWRSGHTDGTFVT